MPISKLAQEIVSNGTSFIEIRKTHCHKLIHHEKKDCRPRCCFNTSFLHTGTGIHKAHANGF
jgi:hypothetical protein